MHVAHCQFIAKQVEELLTNESKRIEKFLIFTELSFFPDGKNTLGAFECALLDNSKVTAAAGVISEALALAMGPTMCETFCGKFSLLCSVTAVLLDLRKTIPVLPSTNSSNSTAL
eukprot:m.182099 g.182099  ORF g.182099 m.182099 type:complete len:115 (+) comp39285_c0_seq21:1479-1823(+)